MLAEVEFGGGMSKLRIVSALRQIMKDPEIVRALEATHIAEPLPDLPLVKMLADAIRYEYGISDRTGAGRSLWLQHPYCVGASSHPITARAIVPNLVRVALAKGMREAVRQLDVVADLDSTPIRIICEVIGFVPAEGGTTIGDVTIVPIDEYEESEFSRQCLAQFKQRYRDPPSARPAAIASLLIADRPLRRQNDWLLEDAMLRLHNTIFAMTSVFGGRPPSIGMYWSEPVREELALVVGKYKWPYSPGTFPVTKVGLDAKDQAQVEQVLRAEGELGRRLRAASRHLNRAMEYRSTTAVAIDCAACLEALLGDRGAVVDPNTIALRASLIASYFDKKRIDTYRRVDSFYAVRRELIYGMDDSQEGAEYSRLMAAYPVVSLALDAARTVLCRLAERGELPTWAHLDAEAEAWLIQHPEARAPARYGPPLWQ